MITNKKTSINFTKKEIIELNDQQTLTINGGTGGGINDSSNCGIDIRTSSVYTLD